MAYSDFDFSEYNEAVISCLCKEYQSLWLINARTLEIHVYSADGLMANMEALDQVENKLGDYNKARQYYIENFIVSDHRRRMLDETRVENILENIADGQLYFLDYRRKYQGKINYNQLVYAKVAGDDEGITFFMMGFRDIDGNKKAERDELTGLYTRRSFIKYAEKRLRDNPDKHYDLIVSDIVDFKQINETYGVTEGDRILKCVGNYLKSYIKGDMIVGRYGGDQFAMLACMEELAERAVNNDIEIEDYTQLIAAEHLPHFVSKFGVYADVEHDASITTICDYAHVALNSIKKDYSKEVAYYDAQLKKKLAVQRKIENCMHEALEQEQFKVYYQPKHDTVTGKLVGAEALVRWVHPEFGFMSPADFIPLFEQNGFVTEVDLYVWEHTCKNLRKWQDKGLSVVPVSVNASKMDFRREGLTAKIIKAVDDAHIDRGLLHVEVTESLLESDMDRLISKLDKLREAGYKVELDDFGSGYSSINFLSSLPIDIVKLDMSFMRDIGDIKRKRVLAACINLAKNLGYETVSEGVETNEQLDLLKLLGADMIQGYYFSKPLSEEDFEKYLEKNS